jgi:hypothetical protein
MVVLVHGEEKIRHIILAARSSSYRHFVPEGTTRNVPALFSLVIAPHESPMKGAVGVKW